MADSVGVQRAREVIARVIQGGDMPAAWDYDEADEVLAALAEAGIEVARWEQVRWEQVGWERVGWGYGGTLYTGDIPANESDWPVFRRVEGGAK